MKLRNPKLYHEYNTEFELYGYQKDQNLCQEAIRMWHSLKDGRRCKLAWDECVNLGYVPAPDNYGQMLEVFARSGEPADAQKFYQIIMKAGHKVGRNFHQIMFDEWLRQGFPGSARQTSRQMKNLGEPLTQSELERLVAGYAKLGGGDLILDIFKEELDMKESPYKMTEELLACAFAGLAHKIIEDNLHSSQKLWNKYNALVIFTPEIGERCIVALGKLRLTDIAISIYSRVKENYKFTPSSSTSIFEAVLRLPPSSTYRLSTRLDMVFSDLKDLLGYKIPPVNIYLAAFDLCSAFTSPYHALVMMKSYVVECYGLPFHRDLCVTFLGLMLRFDRGHYKEKYRAWLNRLVPRQREPNVWLEPMRQPLGEVSDLATFLDENLSVNQSLIFGKFVSYLEPEQLVTGEEPENIDTATEGSAVFRRYSELFTGGDIDVEDALIFSHSRDPKEVYRVLGTDTDVQGLKEQLRLWEEEDAKLRARKDQLE
eukprot:TRINITY_DN4413_c0_g2_i1.p1 TRINITY_DN4413_c0_g2~~TRINITY_DN4413_c0_g2_i1.p1  ORF type:complete len:484 (+),score=109.54 TRINITY_DN4413_c0_g2_i1:1502-2953(+)